MTGLTEWQEKVLALAPLFPSLLSIVGSSTIIYLVTIQDEQQQKHKNSSNNNNNNHRHQCSPSSCHCRFHVPHPYKRLLLGISIFDVIYSINCLLQPFLLPSNTSNKAYAIGNETTCTISGALFQFGFSEVCYYGMLSYYYLFTIRYGWSHTKFETTIEPYMHIISIGYPLITSIVLAFVGVYDEMDLDNGCWIDNYPRNCDIKCDSNNQPDGCNETCLSPIIGWIVGGIPFLIVLGSILIINVVIVVYVRRTILQIQSRSTTAITKSSSISVLGNEKRQAKRIRQVATQGFLYVVAYSLSYVWPLVLQILESIGYTRSLDGKEMFSVLLLQSLIRPLTGFFNLLVYIRPRYVQCREKFKYETKWWCLQRTLFADKIQPKNSNKKTNSNNHNNNDGSQSARSKQQRTSEEEKSMNSSLFGGGLSSAESFMFRLSSRSMKLCIGEEKSQENINRTSELELELDGGGDDGDGNVSLPLADVDDDDDGDDDDDEMVSYCADIDSSKVIISDRERV